MRVLLVRHGEAIPQGTARDPERWLTPTGRLATRAIGKILAEDRIVPTHFFASPLVRAVQTAEILADATGFAGEVSIAQTLAGGSTASMTSILDAIIDESATVMLVGHEPSIRLLATHLSGVHHLADFATSTVCAVDWHGDHGHGAWILSPSTGRPVPFR